MEVFQDSEVVFADTFALKPSRTVHVPTNAPIQTRNVDVKSSAGVYSFPEDSPFADRFIVWRAYGQFLTLEERSFQRTIIDGCVHLQFSRTPIVPGTSIRVSDGVLSLIVPTQSSVHRFYARVLHDDKIHGAEKSISVISQLNKDDIVADLHDAHLLETKGQPVRATVSQSLGHARAAYCMAEGHLVLVHMPSTTCDKASELVLREGGLMRRLLGGDGNEGTGVIDACAVPHSHSIIAVYRDGAVRVWSGETKQVTFSTDMNNLEMSIRPEQLSEFLVRCYSFAGRQLVVLAANSSSRTEVCVCQLNGDKLVRLTDTATPNSEVLLDVCLSRWRGSSCRLVAMWAGAGGSSNTRPYVLKHATLNLGSRSVGYMSAWREVSGPLVEEGKEGRSIDALRHSILDAEAHPWEVVARAVRVSCDGYTDELCAIPGDWAGVWRHVEAYMRSAEFDAHWLYTEGERRMTVGGKADDQHREARRRFLEELLSATNQLDAGSWGALALLNVPCKDSSCYGVIQQSRFTVVRDAMEELSTVVDRSNERPLRAVIAAAKKLASRQHASLSDSEEASDDAMDEDVAVTAGDVEHAVNIFKKFIAHCDVKCDVGNTGAHTDCPFGGSFSLGLQYASMRQRVLATHRFAMSGKQFCEWLKTSCYSANPALGVALLRICHGYRVLADQLELYVYSEQCGTEVSVCSWLWRAGAAQRMVQGYEGEEERPIDDDIHEWIEHGIEACLCAVWPLQARQSLAAVLAEGEKWSAVRAVCAMKDNLPVECQAALGWFNAVALAGAGKETKAVDALEQLDEAVVRGDAGLRAALSDGASDEEGERLTMGAYYVKALGILQDRGHSDALIRLAKKAVAALPAHDENLIRIQTALFTHTVRKSDWAYALYVAQSMRCSRTSQSCIRELVAGMYTRREWSALYSLLFTQHEQQLVVQLLQSYAANQPALARPHPYEWLAGYYVQKDQWDMAARTWYDYASALRMQTQTPAHLERRRDALAAASNAIGVLDKNMRHMPIVALVGGEGEGDVEEMDEEPVIKKKLLIVTEDMLREEFLLCDARVCLLHAGGEVPPNDPTEIVKQLADKKHYDHALAVCKQTGECASGVLYAVTKEAVLCDAGGLRARGVEPEWVRGNRRHVEEGGGGAGAEWWRVVRGLTQCARRWWPEDARVIRAPLDAVLAHKMPVPAWLHAILMEDSFGDYLRALVDYDAIPTALRVLSHELERATQEVKSVEARVWLPYAAIDDLFTVVNKQPVEDKNLLELVRTRLKAYSSRVVNFETAARFAS